MPQTEPWSSYGLNHWCLLVIGCIHRYLVQRHDSDLNPVTALERLKEQLLPFDEGVVRGSGRQALAASINIITYWYNLPLTPPPPRSTNVLFLSLQSSDALRNQNAFGLGYKDAVVQGRGYQCGLGLCLSTETWVSLFSPWRAMPGLSCDTPFEFWVVFSV